jgi:hypothetical protein
MIRTNGRNGAFVVVAVIALLVLLVAVGSTVLSQENRQSSASPEQSGRDASASAPTAPIVAPAVDLSRVRFTTHGWETDFGKHSVPLSEIMSGGPPRDGIPPIDRPRLEPVDRADLWLAPQEPVIHLQIGSEARAYPLQILIWHEIVNDLVGETPVAVTFCPLCNSAIAFDRRLNGRVLDFGTTGNLRHSDLVMWDRQTESWWQQFTGEAIVGELTGQRLEMIPAPIIAWEDFRLQHPHGQVLSRNTGFSRSYGQNPYLGYDRVDQSPFLFDGKPDGRLLPMERVVAVSLNDEAVAYPFLVLRERRVVADRVGGESLVVFFQPGTTSALDGGNIPTSRDVGAAAAYIPEAGGRHLTFTWDQDTFADVETGSRWTLLGTAISGPLAGEQLKPVVGGSHFWFAWAVFNPQTRVYQPD